jgi:hypothetical protein
MVTGVPSTAPGPAFAVASMAGSAADVVSVATIASACASPYEGPTAAMANEGSHYSDVVGLNRG